MRVTAPLENFPEPDTVATPAVIYDGEDGFLCYRASVRAGGGNVVLQFKGVIDLRITPMNVDGLGACRYPIEPWEFNEIFGAEETSKWGSARFWVISFRDITIEIVFDNVDRIYEEADYKSKIFRLMNVLRTA